MNTIAGRSLPLPSCCFFLFFFFVFFVLDALRLATSGCAGSWRILEDLQALFA